MTLETSVYGEGIKSNGLAPAGAPSVGVLESSKLFMPHGQSLQDITRLVVLVPEAGLQPGWLKSVLGRLNVPDDVEIALVGLIGANRTDRAERRRLSALSLRLREEYPGAYGQLINRDNWACALQGFTQSHDLLVCFSEQQVADGFSNRQPLSQALMHALSLPVIEVAGAYPTPAMRLWASAKRLLFQVFPFVIVGLFFWLQAQISAQAQGVVYQVAIGGSVIVELGLIFVWSLFLDT